MGRILTVVVNRLRLCLVDLGSQRELSGLILVSDLARDSVRVVWVDTTHTLMGLLIWLIHGVL